MNRKRSRRLRVFCDVLLLVWQPQCTSSKHIEIEGLLLSPDSKTIGVTYQLICSTFGNINTPHGNGTPPVKKSKLQPRLTTETAQTVRPFGKLNPSVVSKRNHVERENQQGTFQWMARLAIYPEHLPSMPLMPDPDDPHRPAQPTLCKLQQTNLKFL